MMGATVNDRFSLAFPWRRLRAVLRAATPEIVGVGGLVAATCILTCASRRGPPQDAVSVITNTPPPPECRLLGPVLGKDGDRVSPMGLTYQAAERELIRIAASKGGNLVVVDATHPPSSLEMNYMPEYVIEGRLFSCPKPAPQPAATTAGLAVSTDAGLSGARPSATATTSALLPPPPFAPAPVPPSSTSPPSPPFSAAAMCEPECSPGYTCVRGRCTAPSCEPACSPGYICLHGTCVSACNPRCEKDEVCSADRICHPRPAPTPVPVTPVSPYEEQR
jgi:hypothetical protein